MTKEEFIAKKAKELAISGYYKLDIKLINECWAEAQRSLIENKKENAL